MEGFYAATFAVLAFLSGLLEVSKKGEDKHISNKDFLRFRGNYIWVYSLMMAGDWLQGPYVYALYQHYGFHRGDIGLLFIAGFGSSLVFGTVVGSLADKYGRRTAALVYCLTYILSCFTKHWNDFSILLVGRLLGGIATSLLWSAFESWLVSEHLKRGYDPDWLGSIFSKAVFVGNGLMAIISALLANYLVENLGAGYTSPFDVAAGVLLVGGGWICLTWSENYGDGAESSSVFVQLANSLQLIRSDRCILLLGAMQGLFEGSMYTFIFLWTPALAPNNEHIPHGLIFACFMVACMAGCAYAGVLMSRGYQIEKYMQWVFVVAAASLMVPVAVHSVSRSRNGGYVRGGVSMEAQIQMLAFCLFEATIGLFWPSMMKLRSQYVPDEKLSTVINCFRIPVNLMVCVVLCNISNMKLDTVFAMCSFFLLVCAWLQRRLCTDTEIKRLEVKSPKPPVAVIRSQFRDIQVSPPKPSYDYMDYITGVRTAPTLNKSG